jgi:mRNA-degrading endonuclease RelE of RelBE toxin-antitoxin system
MWRVFVANSAQKALARVPAADATRIMAAIRETATDPFTGDIRQLTASNFRRRVGAYRIVYEVDHASSPPSSPSTAAVR